MINVFSQTSRVKSQWDGVWVGRIAKAAITLMHGVFTEDLRPRVFDRREGRQAPIDMVERPRSWVSQSAWSKRPESGRAARCMLRYEMRRKVRRKSETVSPPPQPMISTRRQKRSRLSAFLVTLVVGQIGCGAPEVRPSHTVSFRVDDSEPAETLAKLVEAHNKEREKEELAPLAPNEKLKAVAQAHADDMAKHRKMDHKGSDGSTPFERMKKAGYLFQNAGENIAFGQRGLGELMKIWMNSEGHKQNILGKFTEIGTAYAVDEDGTPYWCVTFGTPPPQ